MSKLFMDSWTNRISNTVGNNDKFIVNFGMALQGKLHS